jgi:hypothetical protein
VGTSLTPFEGELTIPDGRVFFTMAVRLSVAPGGATGTNTRTFTLRINNTDTALFVTLTGTDVYGSASVAVPFGATDTASVIHEETGAPAASSAQVTLTYV